MINPQWIGYNPGNFRRGRGPANRKPLAIVIHVMAGTLGGTDAWFSDPAAKVSAHYGVGKNGEVHQYVSEDDTAFHAGTVVNPTAQIVLDLPNVNPNFYTIGIEHEGQATDAWTTQQASTSAELIAQIAARHAIPLDAHHVFAHQEVRASKPCPGSLEKAAQILRLAAGVPPVAPAAPDQPSVNTVTNVRVRSGSPSTMSPVLTILRPGTSLLPRRNVTGDSVQGNSNWYMLVDGSFIWAGATDRPNPAGT
jgi:N-acetylmuramoyl-L-alanine amidase